MDWNNCYFGDCRDFMRDWIRAGVKVQTVVTSPPYWGLRDYGAPGQIGLERTPIRYLARMRSVMRLVRDLLADDGVAWLNMGDSYATGAGKVGEHPGGGEQGRKWAGRPAPGRNAHAGRGVPRRCTDPKRRAARPAPPRKNYGPIQQPNRMPQAGLKPKDMVGMPWMLALVLRADGWYLRQEIIWHKPNAMPESTKDRCTKAHEQLFLLSKSERYYYDRDAIAEPANFPLGPRNMVSDKYVATSTDDPKMRTKSGLHRIGPRDTRNKRSVWTIATEPFSGAHFATFPRKLVEPCILAGSRPGDVVFDPFMGSGTVAQVAEHLGRRWLGCELQQDYEALQAERLRQVQLSL